jgi:hypothetical protein
MGFNPFRPQRRSPVDYVLVVVAVAVSAILVLWAAGAI